MGGAEDFSDAVLRKSVAKVCVEMGYTSINGSSLQVIVELVTKFIHKFAVLMRVNAEHYCERSFNEIEDAFFAMDSLGMTLEDVLSCVRDFNPGSLDVDVAQFPVAFPQKKQSNFFNASADEPTDFFKNLEISGTPEEDIPSGSTPLPREPDSLPEAESHKQPTVSSSVSPNKPLSSVALVSPVASNLDPCSAAGGMLPTSVTLTYEESENPKAPPLLTPKKVALLKQNLLKKPTDVVDFSLDSTVGTVSRKLPLGIDAKITSSSQLEQTSPPSREVHAPEMIEVTPRPEAVAITTSAFSASSEKSTTSLAKKSSREDVTCVPANTAPLVKTLPIPPPNARAASAIDHETETSKTVCVRGMVIKRVKTENALPVLQFPQLPAPKKKIPKKKDPPAAKMQIPLGTLLTEKQKVKLSAQIQQEQELQGTSSENVSVGPSDVSVWSGATAQDSEMISQESQDDNEYEDDAESGEENSADSSFESFDTTNISNQQEPSPLEFSNDQHYYADEFLPKVIKVESCADVTSESNPQLFEQGSGHQSTHHEISISPGTIEIQTPAIPDTPDVSTPVDKFSHFSTPLIVHTKQEPLPAIAESSNISAGDKPKTPSDITGNPPSPALSLDDFKKETVDNGDETDAESVYEKPISPCLDEGVGICKDDDFDTNRVSNRESFDDLSALSQEATFHSATAVFVVSDDDIEIPPSPELPPLTPSTSNEIPRSPNLDEDLNSAPNSVGISSPVEFQAKSQHPNPVGIRSEANDNHPSPDMAGGSEKLSGSVLDLDVVKQEFDLSVTSPQLKSKDREKSSGRKRKHSSEQKQKKKHKKSKREHSNLDCIEETMPFDEDAAPIPKLILKFGGKSLTIEKEDQNSVPSRSASPKVRLDQPIVETYYSLSDESRKVNPPSRRDESMKDLLAKAELMHSAVSLSVKTTNNSDLVSPITPIGCRDSDFTNTSPNLPPLVGTADSFHSQLAGASQSTTSFNFGSGVKKEPLDGDPDQEWICPSCSLPDNGVTPMIGCDRCDAWYHWQCLGITMEPAVEKWFCPKCSRDNKNFSSSAKKKSKKSSSSKKR